MARTSARCPVLTYRRRKWLRPGRPPGPRALSHFRSPIYTPRPSRYPPGKERKRSRKKKADLFLTLETFFSRLFPLQSCFFVIFICLTCFTFFLVVSENKHQGDCSLSRSLGTSEGIQKVFQEKERAAKKKNNIETERNLLHN